MRRASKRHPELADEEKNRNKLTSTPHTLKSQHRKLRKGCSMGEQGMLMEFAEVYADGS